MVLSFKRKRSSIDIGVTPTSETTVPEDLLGLPPRVRRMYSKSHGGEVTDLSRNDHEELEEEENSIPSSSRLEATDDIEGGSEAPVPAPAPSISNPSPYPNTNTPPEPPLASRPRQIPTRPGCKSLQERIDILLAEPWIDKTKLTPESVFCRRCNKTVRLDKRFQYYAANWFVHKKRCEKKMLLLQGAGAGQGTSKGVGEL